MTLRSTYTYAVMEINPSSYAEIREKLAATGYQHAIHPGADGEVLDMHGIALQVGPPSFPRGRLNASDEGAASMGVAVDQDTVVIAFHEPMAWIGMSAEEAEQLADHLKTKAAEAKRNRQ